MESKNSARKNAQMTKSTEHLSYLRCSPFVLNHVFMHAGHALDHAPPHAHHALDDAPHHAHHAVDHAPHHALEHVLEHDLEHDTEHGGTFWCMPSIGRSMFVSMICCISMTCNQLLKA